MNKYQEYLLKNYLGKNFIFDRCCPLANELEGSKIQYGKFDKETDTFILTQDEDINIIEYVLLIEYTTFSNMIDIYTNAKSGWEKVNVSNFGERQLPIYKIVLNFNDRIDSLKLCFKNNLADDYIIKFEYIEADKTAYLIKLMEQKKADLLKTASIKHSTGNDLVNIYFQPCCDEYERTEITLFKDNQMLAKYKVDDGVFFKSISGLAYGNYEYIVKQFGQNDKLLLETAKFQFSINRLNCGGKPVISW